MPSLTIPNDISFFYEDSGPVPGSNYTTLVFIHGMGFNGGVFKKLLAPAAKHGFRVVSLYRRDYKPSTSFGEAEFGLLQGGVEGHRKYLAQQGVELALFLDRFIVEQAVPPAASNGEGGVVPIGWSLGSINIHAFLSSLDKVPKETLDRLEKYIQTVVIHDVSATGLGVTNPSEYNIDLWFTPDVKERFRLFKDWAVAYYKHTDIRSGKNETIEFNIASTEKKPSLHDISDEELESLTSWETFGGSDTLILFTDKELSKEEARRALFDKNLATYLPNVRVRYLGGAEIPGILLWALWQLQKYIDDPSSFGGEKARDVKILYTPRGNHFIFWDEPDEALVQYRRCLVE
ncbi:hypothetical protein AX16_009075 [Volvariella volvacea WC 439]|nr:hypothetical protein AX16_009075 [Volvariella volvacea WC 439]